MTQQPADGETYLASDGQWYRWPNPTPYPSREAAEARDTWAVRATPIPASQASWTAPPAKPSTGVAQPTLYLAVLLIGGPILAGAVGFLVLPHHVDHGCHGIGFGCSPSPAESAVFFAYYALFFTVPGLVLGSAVMLVLVRVWPWYRRLKAVPKILVLVGLLAAPLVLIRVVGLIYYAVQ